MKNIYITDIIEQIETLKSEIESNIVENDDDDDGDVEELENLTILMDELSGCGGDEQWEGNWYPSMLIHEDNFNDYMDEILEDCGDIPKNLPSYLTITVDYDALQQDYPCVEYDGETYWYRC